MMDAIASLSPLDEAAQRLKLLTMLDKEPGRLFFTKLDLSAAGPTHKIRRAILKPTEFYLGVIAAVRAGNLNWDAEDAGC